MVTWDCLLNVCHLPHNALRGGVLLAYTARGQIRTKNRRGVERSKRKTGVGQHEETGNIRSRRDRRHTAIKRTRFSLKRHESCSFSVSAFPGVHASSDLVDREHTGDETRMCGRHYPEVAPHSSSDRLRFFMFHFQTNVKSHWPRDQISWSPDCPCNRIL